MHIECNDRCRYGTNCQNKNLQQKIEAPLAVFALKWGHLGLRSKAILEPGQFICEYIGEVIDKKELERRKILYKNDECKYMFEISPDQCIDAKNFGNFGRFINHSCDPNAICVKVNTLNEIRLAFFAVKVIEIGAEITFNYGNLKGL